MFAAVFPHEGHHDPADSMGSLSGDVASNGMCVSTRRVFENKELLFSTLFLVFACFFIRVAVFYSSFVNTRFEYHHGCNRCDCELSSPCTVLFFRSCIAGIGVRCGCRALQTHTPSSLEIPWSLPREDHGHTSSISCLERRQAFAILPLP